MYQLGSSYNRGTVLGQIETALGSRDMDVDLKIKLWKLATYKFMSCCWELTVCAGLD